MQKKTTCLSVVASLFLATNLYSQTKQISEITVVSATKSEQSIKDVTSNVEVITKEEIEEKNFTTVTEALNSLVGINITSNGGLGKSSSVFMRGFDSQRVLVLIDGINYNDFTGISGARFEHLLISDVEQIEVIKGAQSGIWGADANAGVINIITKDARLGTSGTIQLEAGSYNTKKFSTQISHATEKYDFKLGVTRLLSDGFTSKAPNGSSFDSFEDDGYQNTTMNLNLGLNLNENNRIEIIHNRINANSEYDNNVYDPGFVLNPTKSANSEGDKLLTKNHYSSLRYKNKNKYSNINLYTNYSKVDRDDPTGWTKEFDGTLKEFGANIEIPYNTDSFILVGSDYKKTNHKNDVDKVSRNSGFFITNSTKFENTIFTQSLRHDSYSLFNNKTTGKVGIKHFLSNNLYISSNYGTSYNAPVFYKLYDSFAGYEDLQPESTKSIDFSIGYKGLKVSVFRNHIDNMIEYNSVSGKYYNMSERAKFRGIEVSYQKDIMSDLLLNLNYAYTKATDNNSKDLQRRAKDSVKLSLDYYGIKDLHLNLAAQYIGDRVEYDYGTYNVKAQTGNYTLWNGAINYQVDDKTKIYLKLDNITDKYYQTVDGYATAGRSAYVGLKYSF
ncbi:TonB-dependent receptor plug domain-containing protein [Halarcobacter sp.]|uniref:TonB-dependent receptor plug domain-containing protein n=1 Tax=Halarcobacter sp. TaxID=2321133 RepID=UPI003A93C407